MMPPKKNLGVGIPRDRGSAHMPGFREFSTHACWHLQVVEALTTQLSLGPQLQQPGTLLQTMGGERDMIPCDTNQKGTDLRDIPNISRALLDIQDPLACGSTPPPPPGPPKCLQAKCSVPLIVHGVEELLHLKRGALLLRVWGWQFRVLAGVAYSKLRFEGLRLQITPISFDWGPWYSSRTNC